LLPHEDVTYVRYPRFVLVALLWSAFVTPAHAQSENRFAIGAEFGARLASTDDAHGRDIKGLLWRFGHGKEGFGFNWGLNWFAADIDRTVAGQTIELGELHVRPFMAGYGYTHNVGAFSITGALLGGFAFTSVSLAPEATDVYHDALGARSISGDAGAALTLRPEIGAWYDVSKKIGLHGSVGYMVARPQVTVSSTLGDDKRRVRADMWQLKIGMAYSIF